MRLLGLALSILLVLPAWADFPVVHDSDAQTNCQTSNSTSWTLSYPTNIASGNLLIGFVGSDGNPTTTWPAGWSKVAEVANGTAVRLVVARKFATGSESGNFTLSLSASEQGCWRIVRITGAHASTEPEAASPATGTSNAPNPGSLNPANWDVEDTLWLAAEAADNGGTSATGFPPGYSNGFSDNSVGGQGAHLGTARNTVRAASEDPGSFTLSTSSEEWATVTIGIRPSVPNQSATPPYRRGTGRIAAVGLGSQTRRVVSGPRVSAHMQR